MNDFYEDSQVWLTGSRMYRINQPDSDEDYIGVEYSPQKILNPFERSDYTQTDDQRVKHSAFKFAQLLVKGNPTILDLVHHEPVQEQPFVKGMVAAARPYSITREVIRGYLGYLHEQKRRGFQQQRKHGHRDTELGYDPKYISHCVRLVFSLRGIYATGEYHYLNEDEINHLLHIRSGEIPYEDMFRSLEVSTDTNGIDPDKFPSSDKLKDVLIGYFAP